MAVRGLRTYLMLDRPWGFAPGVFARNSLENTPEIEGLVSETAAPEPNSTLRN
jgi:hypothetical protein